MAESTHPCDSCGSREATIHLTQMEGTGMVTRRLCEACAADKGVQSPPATDVAPLADFLAQLGKTAGSPAVLQTACPACGLELAALKQTGRLGCSVCYTHYAGHLRGLLRKLHGGTRHVGKTATEAARPADSRPLRLLQLRRDLERCIAAEDFERAAGLRDQIRSLEEQP